MAEEPASKPFHVIPLNERSSCKPRPSLFSGSFLCGGFEFMRSPFPAGNNSATSDMPSRRFPKPWTVEPMPSGYWVTDAMVLVYGQPDGAIAISDSRLTSDEARRISKLIRRPDPRG
jgi:hypothetical protein